MPAVPAVIGAGGAIGSSLIGSNAASSTYDQAQKELQPFRRGAMRNADELSGNSRQLFGQAMPAVQQSLDYYKNLLGANGRKGLYSAVAPAAGTIAENYRGATSSLTKNLRGGERDMGLAELKRQQVGDTARLVSGVQPGAAAALGGMGSGLVGQAQSGFAGAGGIYGGLAGQPVATELGYKAGSDSAGSMGALLARLMSFYPSGGKGKSAQAPPSADRQAMLGW